MYQLRVTLRSLLRSPSFAIVMTIVLAAGVGAGTAIFSVANWALFRPLPGVERPSELVAIRAERADGSLAPLSHAQAQAVIESGAPAATVGAAYLSLLLDVATGTDAQPVRVRAQVVGPGFFEVLGLTPDVGRVFSDEEVAATGRHAVALVSHSFWRRTLGSDQDPLRRTIVVNGSSVSIVGVLPASFSGIERTSPTDVWLPASAVTIAIPRLPAAVLRTRFPIWPSLVMRRVPGLPAAAVAEAASRGVPEIAQAGGRLEASDHVGMSASLRERITETVTAVGALGLLLVALTVSSLVNLVLSRVARREGEVVVQRALGASAWRVARQYATEAVFIGLLGGGVALLVSAGLARVVGVRGLITGQPGGIPIDGTVFLFALGASMVATLVAAALAAIAVHRLTPLEVLRHRHAGASVGRRGRAMLAGVQAALALALVTAANLSGRSLTNLRTGELGFTASDVMMFSVNPGSVGYSDADADQLMRGLVDELRALPGVSAAGFMWLAPFGAQRYAERVLPAGASEAGSDAISANANMISPGLLEALGMELVAGRTFAADEYERRDRPTRGHVVINETLAGMLFPSGSAVGRELRMPGRREEAFEVIGVVRDARLRDVREAPGPDLYDPFGNGYLTSSATFVLRTDGSAGALMPAIHEMLRTRDPRVRALEMMTMTDRLDQLMSEEIAVARITALLAALAALLAAFGLYGLLSEAVLARRYEMGVRQALGAGPLQMLGATLRHVATPVGIGLVAGIAASTQVGRLLQTQLVGVSTSDPGSIITAVLFLTAVCVVALTLPAVRALRSDPLAALRGDG